jgi:hypothetical protein
LEVVAESVLQVREDLRLDGRVQAMTPEVDADPVEIEASGCPSDAVLTFQHHDR